MCEPEWQVVCAALEALPERRPEVVEAAVERLAGSSDLRICVAARRKLGWAVHEAARELTGGRRAPAEGDEEDWRRYLPVLWRPPLPARRPGVISPLGRAATKPEAEDQG